MTQHTDDVPAIPEVPPAALRPSLEAVLMVADQPLDAPTLATAVGHPVDDVVAALQLLAEEYAEQGRGFELRHVAGGWRYYTRPEHAAVVERFVLEGQQARLTQAALETLAVVAYTATGLARPGLRDPRRQRRRRDAHPDHPRPRRGGRPGPGDRCEPVPHHRVLPGADRRHRPGRPPRRSRRTCPTWTTWRRSWPRWPPPSPRPRPKLLPRRIPHQPDPTAPTRRTTTT